VWISKIEEFDGEILRPKEILYAVGLVEVGFVTGREDAAKLANPGYQSQMAQAIARGILQYIQQT
jgi:N-acetylmuramoyl-L-alanine amidase